LESWEKKTIVNRQEKTPLLAPDRESKTAVGYFEQLAALIPHLPFREIEAIAAALLKAQAEERTVFVFGNGGSAASASHMMCDLNKGTIEAAQGRRFKVMSLTDNVPLLTAWANDSTYDRVFSEQLKNFVRRGDVAFAISASGSSPNVLLALQTARARGARTLGVTGYRGGKMKLLCDICAVVPSDQVPMIEDMHHAILHSIFTVVEARLRDTLPIRMAAAGGRFAR
jgi:D-sedoheptulose 7-phosphate isomerase